MSRRTIAAIVIPLLCAAPYGCDEPLPEPQAVQAAAITGSADGISGRDDVDARLLSSLASRRSWSTRQVKVDLERPDLRIELANPSGQRRIVDAWASTATDLDVPMLRVDWSERLYELTSGEWSALKQRADR